MKFIHIPAMALLVATTLLVTEKVVAQPGPGDRDFRTTPVLQMLSQRLDLTDEQKTRIGALLVSAKDEMKEPSQKIKGILEKARQDIAATLTDEQKTKFEEMKNGVMKGVGGYARAHGEEIKEQLQSAGEEVRIRAALSSMELTAEQKDKLKEVQESLAKVREEVRRDLMPKMEAAQKEAREKIMGALSAEQKAELEKKMQELPRVGDMLKNRMEARRDRRDDAGPANGPGGKRGGSEDGRGPAAGRERRGPQERPAEGDTPLRDLFR